MGKSMSPTRIKIRQRVCEIGPNKNPIISIIRARLKYFATFFMTEKILIIDSSYPIFKKIQENVLFFFCYCGVKNSKTIVMGHYKKFLTMFFPLKTNEKPFKID